MKAHKILSNRRQKMLLKFKEAIEQSAHVLKKMSHLQQLAHSLSWLTNEKEKAAESFRKKDVSFRSNSLICVVIYE